jgi:vacuolar-type H+-ATPase subunit F/Vma7
MKIACLGDRLSILGIGMAGVKTLISVEDAEDARNKLTELASSEEFGLILITSNIFRQVEDTVNELKSASLLPVFLQIPEMRLLEGADFVG